MNAVDFKVTTWERIYVPDNAIDLVKQGIENGTITCSNDLYDIDEIADELDCEILPETFEQMSVEENDGQATIEFLVDRTTITTNLNLKN